MIKYIGEIRERVVEVQDGSALQAEIRAKIAELQGEITTKMTEVTRKIQLEYDKNRENQFNWRPISPDYHLPPYIPTRQSIWPEQVLIDRSGSWKQQVVTSRD